MAKPPKISALIFDLDGTAIPNKLEGLPSKRVIQAVRKANKLVFVSVATGRPHSYCKVILQKFAIKRQCIVYGGTQLVDPLTGKIFWEEQMDLLTVLFVQMRIQERQ